MNSIKRSHQGLKLFLQHNYILFTVLKVILILISNSLLSTLQISSIF